MATPVDILQEEDEKMMERRLKERNIISGLDTSSKKKMSKEFKKMAKDMSLRLQVMREKMEGQARALNRQANAGDGSSAAADQAIREKGVEEMVEMAKETSAIQKVLQISIEEGADTARGFNEEQFSFSLSEKDRKEIQKIKKRKEEKKKKKKNKKQKFDQAGPSRGAGRGFGGVTCFNCGKPNHIAKFCKSKVTTGKRKREDSDSSDSSDSSSEES